MKPFPYTEHLAEYITRKLPPALSRAILTLRPIVLISDSAPEELYGTLDLDVDLAGQDTVTTELTDAIQTFLPHGSIYIDDQMGLYEDSIPFPDDNSQLKQVALPDGGLPDLIRECGAIIWRAYGFTRPLVGQPTLVYLDAFQVCGFLLFHFEPTDGQLPLHEFYASIPLPEPTHDPRGPWSA